jgi:hypothetical protein
VHKIFASLTVLAALVAVPSALHATPITGQFSITGASVSDDGSTLTFDDPSTVTVGGSKTITGAFKDILSAGETGTITSSVSYKPYTPGSAVITLTNTDGTTLTFTLDSLTEEPDNNGFEDFMGTGILSTNAAGYDNTEGTLAFSTQGDGTVTFAATTVANSAVPEPSTLAFFGTGLVGLAGVIKRRLA